jgi:hypothetical protein
MAWPACRRHEIAPAPGGLALAQDLLNTRPSARAQSADLLGTVRAAQEWSEQALAEWGRTVGRPHRRTTLAKADVEALREVRTGLAEVLRRRGEPGLDAAPFAEVELRAGVGPDGAVTLEPTGAGWRQVAGAVLIELHRAQVDNTFRRLKTCRNERCPGAFYDRSPNNSGAWHDVLTCGNVANLRASRARRKADADAAEVTRLT